MGSFRVPAEIANLGGGRFDRLQALVDTGATYTSWPRDRLAQLGIEPEEQRPFELADGTQITCDVGWARVRLAGKTQPTIVIFGEPDSEALLGAFTLEAFLLAVDPARQRLVSVPGLLKRAS